MLRARGVLEKAIDAPGGAMPKIRTVVFWTVAGLITFALEVVGLDRAMRLRDQLTSVPSCPAPAVVVEAPPAPTVPAPAPPPPAAASVRLLVIKDDAVVIEAGGRRHELPGYPPPREGHDKGFLTSATIAP